VKRITIANPKGGVGKSLVTILLIEWFLHRGVGVSVRDADANQTVQTWLRLCEGAGRDIPLAEENVIVELIDTAGLADTLTPFLAHSDVVVTPYKPLTPDVTRLVRWFQELAPEERAKVYTMPNMLRFPNPTRDEVAGCELVHQLLERSELPSKHRLPGLGYRPAAFGSVYNGSAENFFAGAETEGVKVPQPTLNAIIEAEMVMRRIEEVTLGSA